MRTIGIAIISLVFLSGCQTGGWSQYHLPNKSQAELLKGIGEIAAIYEMENKTADSKASGTLLFYTLGDTSFTHIGVRDVSGKVVVDLYFRSAGRGGKQYRQLDEKLSVLFQQLYGVGNFQVTDRDDLIPYDNKAEQIVAANRLPAES